MTRPAAAMRDHGLRRELAEPLRALTRGAADAGRAVRRVRSARAQPRQLDAYLRGTAEPKLHLGAGHHLLDGWLNTDRDPSSEAVHLDAAAPLPVEGATFAYVFSEHLIEHLPYADGLAMLSECHRVLRPGGRIRTATPDLATIVGLLDGAEDGIAERYATWLAESYFPDRHGPPAAFAVNQALRGWGHAFLYDEPTLRATLEGAGFVDVRRHEFGHSDDPALAGLEDHGVPDGNGDLSAFETMALEATRP